MYLPTSVASWYTGQCTSTVHWLCPILRSVCIHHYCSARWLNCTYTDHIGAKVAELQFVPIEVSPGGSVV